MSGKRIGVLALQGNFREHLRTLAACGAQGAPIRLPAELEQVDGLIIPGGESTTIGRLLEKFGLLEPVQLAARRGKPLLGTCAGMIVMAKDIVDGVPGQARLALMDITVRRNAFGRQVDSFEAPLDVKGLEGPRFPGVFIRSPLVERLGPGVEALAAVEGRPVAVRQSNLLALSFHPELTEDRRLHRLFLSMVDSAA